MMKKFYMILIILAFIAVIIVGCGATGSDKSRSEEFGQEMAVEKNMRSTADFAEEDAENDLININYERKVIKNCEISITVENIEQVVKEIENKTEIIAGLVSEANFHVSENGTQRSADLELRIPSANFVEVIQFLEEKGEVRDKRVYTNDVTEEYIDLDAKIKVLEAEENTLLAILEKAKNVDEMLKVKQYLLDVKKERESLQGRLNYLNDKVSYSTIRVYLYQPITSDSQIGITGFNNVWERSMKAFIRSINGMIQLGSNMIVMGFGAIPLLIPLVIIILIVYLRRKKRKSSQNNLND